MKKKMIEKKLLAIVAAAVLVMGMLAGCGNKEAEKEEPKQEAAEEEEPAAEEEEEAVAVPFAEDLEKYDSIISTLTTEQYYAFAGVADGYDVLLVSPGVFDNGDGNMAAIEATVYGIDNGQPSQAGTVTSAGTAYPIAVYEDMLMFGGNHQMAMANVVDGSLVVQREAYEEFDDKGNAKYFLNEGDIDSIKELEDDSALKEMFEKYNQATVINFFQGKEPIGDKEVGDYPSNEFEARVNKFSFDSYDEIIGLLEGDEAYALVNVKGADGEILLVAEAVYDDLEGHMATIECTPYSTKSTGKVTADSVLVSGGTATPIVMDKEGNVFTTTHQSIEKLCYGENGTPNKAIMIMASVFTEELDDNGNPKTVNGFVRTKNSVVDDDSVFLKGDEVELWTQLWDEYKKAEPVNFTKVTK